MNRKAPYTNFHELNLDYVLSLIKNMFGGTAGQILKKRSSAELDFEWTELTAADVGALPESYSPPVQSVNGKTGSVELTAQDIGALPVDYSPPVESVNGKTGRVELNAADVNALPESYSPPVTSVNGKIGAVQLRAADVFALPSNYVPPVISVNGKTGAVELTSSDVGALPDDFPAATKADILSLLPSVNIGGEYLVAFSDGENTVPIKLFVIVLAPIQSGSGDPSPDNVRPISGHTELTVRTAGKNLLPPGVDSERSGIVFTVQNNGEVVASGTAAGNSFWGAQFTIPPGSYTLSGCPAGGGISNYRVEIRDRVGGNVINQIIDSGSGARFTINEPLTAVVNIRIADGYITPPNGLKFSPMIRPTQISNSTFAAYTANDIIIEFGSIAGTVYAGAINITDGIIASRPYYQEYDGEPLTGPWISSMDVYTPGAIPTIGAQVVDLGGAVTEYEITPRNINTRLGDNSIWSTAGEIAITYYANIQKYIDGRLS